MADNPTFNLRFRSRLAYHPYDNYKLIFGLLEQRKGEFVFRFELEALGLTYPNELNRKPKYARQEFWQEFDEDFVETHKVLEKRHTIDDTGRFHVVYRLPEGLP